MIMLETMQPGLKILLCVSRDLSPFSELLSYYIEVGRHEFLLYGPVVLINYYVAKSISKKVMH